MTSTSSGAAGWGSASGPTTPGAATVSGDITALNPVDGLFLRAEHLRTIESYARDLVWAVGIGSGTGAVYGFHVTLDLTKPALNVQPGLAISPVGQPLRSSTTAVVSLDAKDLPAIGNNGFWVIEVTPAWWPFGEEKVYGNLCDEPCSGSDSAIRPWIAEGVTVRLRADDLPGLAEVQPGHRRNWLASQYFERERRQGYPWLVPSQGPSAVASILSHDWTDGIGQPVGTAVPIGAIQLVNDVWTLDVWTARRDVGGPPADSAWRSRLAMRPWNVFMAQILQFQDQLSSLHFDDALPPKDEAVDARDAFAEEFIAKIKDTPVGRWSDFKSFVAHYRDAAAQLALSAAGESLSERGFDELPPAGFIVGSGLGRDSRKQLESFFGKGVRLRICLARADAIATEVEEAQQLDRIPLQSQYGVVDVDILVPDRLADLPGTRTEDYGWAAFVRRRLVDCEGSAAAADDLVDVYVVNVEQPGEIPAAVVDMFKKAELPPGVVSIGQLAYPAGGWEFPGGELAAKVAQAGPFVGMLAVTADEQRGPLMALRAHLFAASLDAQAGEVLVQVVVPVKPFADALVALVQTQFV